MVKVKRTGEVISKETKIARDIYSKTMGLMFKKEMSGFDGLLIEACNSIHTFFCRFDLDILFLSKENKVVRIYRSLRPWRMTTLSFKTTKVLELNGGTLTEDLKIGDEVIIDV